MPDELNIIRWPDPRLKKPSLPVAGVTPELRELALRMLDLMREARGVGLAAPQVGRNIRLFVMNATGDPADDHIYLNPLLSELDGEDEAEEGCLSLPNVNIKVVRSKHARLSAQDLEGNAIDIDATGFVARIWQHETDHLNGMLLTDRMGPVARMTHRRVLKELEEQYQQQLQPRRRRTVF